MSQGPDEPQHDWSGVDLAVGAEDAAGQEGGSKHDWSGVDLTMPTLVPKRNRAREREKRLRERDREMERLRNTDAEPSLAEKTSSAGRAAWGGLVDWTLSGVEGVGRAGAGAEHIGAPKWVGEAGEFLVALSQEAKRDIPPADPRVEDSFVFDTVPRAFGQVASSLLTFGAGGVAAATGTSMLAGGATLMAEAETTLNEKVAAGEMGAEEAEARGWGVFLAGMGLGATDAMPLGWMLGRANRATGGGVRAAVRRILTGGLTTGGGATGALKRGARGMVFEGGQELGQTMGENAALKWMAEDERKLMEGVAEASAAGGIVGAVLTLALGQTNRALRHKAAKQRRARRQAEAQEGSERTEPVGGAEPTAPDPSSPAQAAEGPLSPEGEPFVDVTAPEGNLDGIPPGVHRGRLLEVRGETALIGPPEGQEGEPRRVPLSWVQRAAAETAEAAEAPGSSQAASEPGEGRDPAAPYIAHALAKLGMEAAKAAAVASQARVVSGPEVAEQGRQGARVVEIGNEDGSPLPFEGVYDPKTNTVVIDRSLPPKTKRVYKLAHETVHHGAELAPDGFKAVRNELERDYRPLMDAWRAWQSQKRKAADETAAKQRAARGEPAPVEPELTPEQQAAKAASRLELMREESVATAAEEVANVMAWVLQDRGRARQLVEGARKAGKRHPLVQRLIEWLGRTARSLGAKWRPIVLQLEELGQRVGRTRFEQTFPEEALDIATRLVGLADQVARVAEARRGTTEGQRRDNGGTTAGPRRATAPMFGRPDGQDGSGVLTGIPEIPDSGSAEPAPSPGGRPSPAEAIDRWKARLYTEGALPPYEPGNPAQTKRARQRANRLLARALEQQAAGNPTAAQETAREALSIRHLAPEDIRRIAVELRAAGQEGVARRGERQAATEAPRAAQTRRQDPSRAQSASEAWEEGEDVRFSTPGVAPSDEVAEDRRSHAAVRDLEQLARDLGQAVPAGDRGSVPDAGRPAGSAGSGVTTLFDGIRRALIREGRVDLRGQVARDTHDLAMLAQVFTDPRFETFRVFYVDDAGKILAHEGLTSRLPGMVLVKHAEWPMSRHAHAIRERMQRLSASGYYLLHNHPSGVPIPSNDDVAITMRLQGLIPGFRGHVVIDHTKYGEIRSDGATRVSNLPSPRAPLHDIKQPAIQSSASLAVVARDLAVPDNSAVVIYTSTAGIVRGIQSVPLGLLGRAQEFTDHVRGQSRAFGAARAFASLNRNNEDLRKKVHALIRLNVLTDALLRGTSQRDQAVAKVGRKLPVVSSPPLRSYRVSESAPDTRFSVPADQSGAPWFSAVERAIEDFKQEKMTSQQALRMLQSAPGVTQEELDFIKIGSFLEQNDRFTKAQLLEHVRAHRVLVSEVQHGGSSEDAGLDVGTGYVIAGTDDIDEFSVFGDDEAGWVIVDPDGNEVPANWVWVLINGAEPVGQPAYFETEGNAREALNVMRQQVRDALDEGSELRRGSPKYANYQIAGGKDYRELLLRWNAPRNKALGYTSSHWEPHDIIAHMRFNERETQSGGRVMFLEEVQSDWHQEGRKKGYGEIPIEDLPLPAGVEVMKGSGGAWLVTQDSPVGTTAPVATAPDGSSRWAVNGGSTKATALARYWEKQGKTVRKVVRPSETAWTRLRPDSAHIPDPASIVEQRPGVWRALGTADSRLTIGTSREDVIQTWIAERMGVHRTAVRLGEHGWETASLVERFVVAGVPEGPFKTSWATLAVKRAIKWAADNGFEFLAWTPGKEQVKRYSTAARQVIDRVVWRPGELTAGVRLVTLLKANEVVVSLTVDPDGTISHTSRSEFRQRTLSDVLGGEMAARIMAEPEGRISDEEIVVGGKGMTEFYDRMLPQIAKKLGKRYGAGVEQIAVPSTDSSAQDLRERIASMKQFRQTARLRLEEYRAVVDNPRGEEAQLIYPYLRGREVNQTGVDEVLRSARAAVADNERKLREYDQQIAEVEARLANREGAATVQALRITDELRSAVSAQGFSTFADKFSVADRAAAEFIYEKHGIAPYLSTGQAVGIETGIDETRFSVRAKSAGGQDPVTGLWLNANGTATLYYFGTEDEVREIQRTGVIPPRRGQNRIYLSNESNSKLVFPPKKGAQPKSVAMVEIDPQLLQFERDINDTAKLFFVPTSEGNSFIQRARQWALEIPRERPVRKDATLAEIRDRMGRALEEYEALGPRERKARLKYARATLAAEHNVTTFLSENAKLSKTELGALGLVTPGGKGIKSMGVGMAAAQQIGDDINACPNSAACKDLCLGNTSGNLMMYGGKGQERRGPRLAQFLKTEAFVVHPEDFAIALHEEINAFERWGAKNESTVSVRLNVTSDIPGQVYRSLIAAHPSVTFYDYTKLNGAPMAPNHHLTYSSSGFSQILPDGAVIVNPHSNWATRLQKLKRGFNVAMAFSKKKTGGQGEFNRSDLPLYVLDESTGLRFEVWDGDTYDARYLDPKSTNGLGLIIGLRNKDATSTEKNATPRSKGFFVHYDPAIHGDTVTVPRQSQFPKDADLKLSVPESDDEATFEASAERFVDYAERRLLQEFAPVERVQRDIGRAGREVTEDQDAALRTKLYQGRQRAHRAESRRLEAALMRVMRRHELDREELDDFALATHAPTRNQVMVDRHPDSFDLEEFPGSGLDSKGEPLTNRHAAEIVARVEAGPKAKGYQEALRIVHRAADLGLRMRVTGGLLPADGARQWREIFGPTYVPMRNAEIDEGGVPSFVRPSGFQMPRKLSRRAEGRRTAAGSPVVWTFAQHDEIVIRAAKNEVDQAAAALVRGHPNDALWHVEPEDMPEDLPWAEQQAWRRERDRRAVEVREGRASEIRFFEGGVPHLIVLKGPIGMGFANALKRLNIAAVGPVGRVLGTISRTFIALATKWSPNFVLRNLAKDVQSAAGRAGIVLGPNGAANILRNTTPALRGALRVLRAERKGEVGPDGTWENMFRRWRTAGGQTGWADTATYEKRVEAFARLQQKGDIRNALEEAVGMFSDLQEAVEMGTRVAGFDAALKAGKSDARAAAFSRDMTVDFNRKGELASVLGNAFWFFNPAIQGSRITLKNIASPAGASLAAGLAALGFVTAWLNRILGEEDDFNRWDEESLWSKHANVTLLLPDSYTLPMPGGASLSVDRVKMPVAWGWNVFWAMGVEAEEMVNGSRSKGESAAALAKAVVDAFNPIGATPTLAQAVTPSLLDPLVQVSQNVSWSGSSIHPETYGARPDSHSSWPDTTPWLAAATRAVNDATGGSSRRSGAIDVGPVDLEYLARAYSSGAGGFVMDVGKTLDALVSGRPVPSNNLPLLRSFVAEPNVRTVSGMVSRAVRDIEASEGEMRDGNDPKRPGLVGLGKLARQYRERIRDLQNEGDAASALALSREFLAIYREAKGSE